MDTDLSALPEHMRDLRRQFRDLDVEGACLVAQLPGPDNQNRPELRSALCAVVRAETTIVQEWSMLVRERCRTIEQWYQH